MWKLWLTRTSDPTRSTKRGPDPIRLTRRGPDPNQPTRWAFFWKLALIRTPDPIRPTRRVLTLTDPRRGHFLKTCNNGHSLHAWLSSSSSSNMAPTQCWVISCRSNIVPRTVIQSYVHACLQLSGCAVVRAVLRSGFRDTGQMRRLTKRASHHHRY